MKVKENSVSLTNAREASPKIDLSGIDFSVNIKLPTLPNISDIMNEFNPLKKFAPNNPIKNNKILQYPASRVGLYEQLAYDGMLDSLYKDNTIFTAYDLKSRERNELVGLLSGVISGKDNYGMNNNMVANILMPRSDTDIDSHKHEFVTSEESLMTRGNGEVVNAIGSGLATMVSGVFDNITKGFFADHGEAIGTPTRATYKGAEHRTKTYTWKLTPRNPQDLISLLNIMNTFRIYSYGSGGKSEEVDKGMSNVISYVEGKLKRGRDVDVDLLSTQILESFKYVKVMTNPTLWFIRNYNHKTLSSDGGLQDTSIFGPANIVDIKIDMAPDGVFNGLAKAPNISSSYNISITFREAISHTRDTIGLVL